MDYIISNKKINYTSLQIICLSICILLIGFFNDFPLINPDSAMFRSPSIFFMWILAFLYLAHIIAGGKIIFKFSKEYIWLIFFFVWVILSFVINFYHSTYIFSENVNGFFLVINGLRFNFLIFIFILTVISLNAPQNRIIYRLSNFFVFSFLLTIPYSILELLSYIFQLDIASALLQNLDTYLHARRGDEYLDVNRVRGLSFEPSYYGVYISTILPFILVKYLLSKVKIYYGILIFFLLLCIIYSQSRTAYVAILIQIIIFYYLYRRYIKGIQNLLLIMYIILIAILIILFITVESENIITSTYQSLFDTTLSSNISRIGAQHAGLLVGLDNPFFGVGPNMSGAHAHNYYPNYMYMSNEIYSWIDVGLISLSAPTFGFFSTLAAELGLFGLFIFLIALAIVGNKVLDVIQTSSISDIKYSIYGAAIFSANTGLYISSFGLNGINYAGYWILLSIALLYIRNK